VPPSFVPAQERRRAVGDAPGGGVPHQSARIRSDLKGLTRTTILVPPGAVLSELLAGRSGVREGAHLAHRMTPKTTQRRVG
jgi:hypothetical protein